MIPEEDAGLLAVARAIAAGDTVDWAAVESSGQVSESFARVLRELKAVAQIAEVHRSVPELSPGARPASSSRLAGPRVPAAPVAPARWGPLTLLEPVGQGAFGDVFRAWDSRLAREVALKLLRQARPATAADDVAQAVIHEGQLLARVRHPNVVTVYGADAIDGRVGIWMEYVHGRTLEMVLRDHGPFGAHEATVIALDVLRALAAVHRAGLVHRDVKSQNVMREDGGRVVLMDFGTGGEAAGGGGQELAGTPLYLAPEIFNGAAATPQSDIYSVGVLLYHLVTNGYPLRGRTIDEIREGHRRRRRTWLRDARPDLPDAFVDVVERALAFDPAARYESAGAMGRELARVVSPAQASAGGEPVPGASDATVATPLPAVLAHARWRRPAMFAAAAIGAAAIVAITLGLDFLSRRDDSPPQNPPAAAATEAPQSRRKLELPSYFVIGTASPSGRWLSMSNADGNLTLFDPATRNLRQVTRDAVFGEHSQYAEGSVVSPDEQWIAYEWLALDGKYELRVVDIEGTRPRVLLRDPSIAAVRSLEWSRDGRFVLVLLRLPNFANQLALVSVNDGQMRRVTDLGTFAPHHASISPDSEFIAYDCRQPGARDARDICVVRANGSDGHRLEDSPANDVDPVWTPNGQSILFVSDRAGTLDLWSMDVASGVAQGPSTILQRNIGRILPLGLTSTGSYYYHETVGAVDVFEAALTAEGVSQPRPLPSAFIGSNISSLYSPDGTQLAYASRRGLVRGTTGWTTLVVRDLTSGPDRELSPAMNAFLLRAWSPDGASILVSGEDSAGRTGFHRIDVASGRVAALLLNAAAQNNLRRPDWLPDGRLVYINSRTKALLARNVATSREEVLWEFGRDQISIVADVMGRGYRLSPDGVTFAYTMTTDGAAPTRSLCIKVLPSGAPREVVRVAAPDLIQLQDWTPDGAALVFTRWNPKADASKASLWRVPLNGGQPQPLGLETEGLRDVSVQPRGSHLTFTAGWPAAEVWVLENSIPHE